MGASRDPMARPLSASAVTGHLCHQAGSGRNGNAGLAGRVRVNPVHEPGGRLGATLLARPAFRRGRDEEPVQAGPAERTARALPGRDGVHLAQRAVGCVAVDPPTAVDRHPEVTGCVHRHSVRCPGVLGHGDQDPASRDGAAAGVERERMDHPRAAVHQIHRVPVRAPAQSVGDRQSVEHELGPSVSFEPVERATSLVVVVGQRPAPEPALGIAGAVVHAGPGRCNLGDHPMGAVGRQVHEAAPRAEQPAFVALHGRDHPDRPRQLVDPDALQRTVVADPAAIDAPGEDVDRQHLVPAGVPPNALTKVGLLGGAADSAGRHMFRWSHRQPPKSTTTLMSSGSRCSASAMSAGGTRREISCASQARSAAASASAAR